VTAQLSEEADMNNFDYEETALWEKVRSAEGEEKAEALIQLSYYSSHRGAYQDSLALCETARDIYENLGPVRNEATLAHIYFGIGFSLRQLKRSRDAAFALGRSASIYQSMGSDEVLQVRNDEGDMWFEAGDFQRSFEAYRNAIEFPSLESSNQIMAKNYADAGTALEKLKRWEDALGYFENARKIYKSLKMLESIAHCDEEISLCYFKLDLGQKALDHAQRALDFAVTARDDYHLMWSYARMGLAYKLLENFEESLKFFELAKSMMVHHETPPWAALIKLEKQVASIYEREGKTKEAEEILRRIAVIAEIVMEEN